jgi:hypothetical protein
MSALEMFDWIMRAFVMGLVGMLWNRVNKSVTKEEMKEYVFLHTSPMLEAIKENTEALKAMTGAFHNVDKKLDKIEVELEYVKKNDD